MDAMAAIAYGDLASAILALIAASFLRYQWRGAIEIAWIVNIVTSVDWVYAGWRLPANWRHTRWEVTGTSSTITCRSLA